MRGNIKDNNKNAFEIMMTEIEGKKDDLCKIYTTGCGNPPPCNDCRCVRCSDPSCQKCKNNQ